MLKITNSGIKSSDYIKCIGLIMTLFLCLQIHAVEEEPINESFVDGKMPSAWKVEMKEGKPELEKNGVVLKAASDGYAFIQRECPYDGTDERPLLFEAYIERAGETQNDHVPGIWFFWDNDNYIGLGINRENRIIATWVKEGKEKRVEVEGIPVYQEGSFLRIGLTTNNVLFFYSVEGVLWNPIGYGEGRKEKEKPKALYIGWGSGGKSGDKQRKEGMANGIRERKSVNAGQASIRIRNVKCRRGAEETEEKVEVVKRGNWRETETFVQKSWGTPKRWKLVGTEKGDKKTNLLDKVFPPDKAESLEETIKKEDGGNYQGTEWTKADDSGYVPVGRELNEREGLAWAETSVQTEREISALLWFKSGDKGRVYLNGRQVLAEDKTNTECVRVYLRKGENQIRVKTAHQEFKEWEFYLWLEKADAAARIPLLTAMGEEYEGAGGKGTDEYPINALLENARRRETGGDFNGALEAYEKTEKKCERNATGRVAAFQEKTRLLEALQNWTGLAEAGERVLKERNEGATAAWARRAAVIGAKTMKEAETKVEEWLKKVETTGPDRFAPYCAWVGAAERFGDEPARLNAWMTASGDPKLSKGYKLTALTEAAAANAKKGKYAEASGLLRQATELVGGEENTYVRRLKEAEEKDRKTGKNKNAYGAMRGALLLAIYAAEMGETSQAKELPPLPETIKAKKFLEAVAEVQGGKKTGDGGMTEELFYYAAAIRLWEGEEDEPARAIQELKDRAIRGRNRRGAGALAAAAGLVFAPTLIERSAQWLLESAAERVEQDVSPVPRVVRAQWMRNAWGRRFPERARTAKATAMAAALMEKADDVRETIYAELAATWGAWASNAAEATYAIAKLRRAAGDIPGARTPYERILREFVLLPDESAPRRRGAPPPSLFDAAAQALREVKEWKPDETVVSAVFSVKETLDTARRELEAEEEDVIRSGVEKLTTIVSENPSEIVPLSSDGALWPLYVSAREGIRRLLGGLSPERRKTYLEAVEPRAAVRLRGIWSLDDAAALTALAAEYPFTKTAAQALNRAGDLLLDEGENNAAAAVFQRLLEEAPEFAGLSVAQIGVKNVQALLKAGRREEALRWLAEIKRKLPRAEIRAAGRKMNIETYEREIQPNVASAAAGEAGKREATGEFAGGLLRDGGAPTDPAPKLVGLTWSRIMPNSPAEEQGFGQIEGLERLNPRQSHPAAAAGRLFVSGLDFLRAYDLKTGTLLWARHWPTHLNMGARTENTFPVSRPTVVGDAVYLRTITVRGGALCCYGAADGNLRWSTAGERGFERMVWLSDPAVEGETVVAPYVEQSNRFTHGAAAVHRETGRLIWKRPLINGNTGWFRQTGRFPWEGRWEKPGVHLGPPAADAGVVYFEGGLEFTAALNMFNGEVIFVSGRPKSPLSGPRRALTNHAMSPKSPMVMERLIVTSPKDGRGLIALDRDTGRVVWRDALSDRRALIGRQDDKILLSDDAVEAVRGSDGETIWTYDPEEPLYGRPALSGGVIYVPERRRLTRLDAKTGAVLDFCAWDETLGPAANLLVLKEGVVGVGRMGGDPVARRKESWLALYGAPDTAPVRPSVLAKARMEEKAGRWEEAEKLFAAAMTDPEEKIEAVLGKLRVADADGRGKSVARELSEWAEKEKKEVRAADQTRAISSAALLEKFAVVGDKITPQTARPPARLDGELGFAWHLSGGFPVLAVPTEGAQDRFFAALGCRLYCLRFGATLEILWETTATPAPTQLYLTPAYLVATDHRTLTAYDRFTGRELWRKSLSPEDGWTQHLCAAGDYWTAGLTGTRMNIFETATGKRADGFGTGDTFGRTWALMTVEKAIIEFTSRINHPTRIVHLEGQTGKEIKTTFSGPFHGIWLARWFSPDGRKVVFHVNNDVLICVDPITGQKFWESKTVAPLHGDRYGGAYLSLTDEGDVQYTGLHSPERGKTFPKTFWLDGKTGTAKATFERMLFRVGDGWLPADEEGKVTRLSSEGNKLTAVWERSLPDARQRPYWRALVGERLFLTYVHLGREERPYFQLRILDWKTGKLLSSRTLPGTPRRRGQWGTAFTDGAVLAVGEGLIYAAEEGLFAFGIMGKNVAEAEENIRAWLKDEKLESEQRIRLRRTLADFNVPELKTFLTPSDAVVDGRTEEWRDAPALIIPEAEAVVPLHAEMRPGGEAAPRVTLRAGWTSERLWLAIETEDDRFVPPEPGAPLESGDSIKIIADSQGAKYVLAAALTAGRTVITERYGAFDEDQRPRAVVRRRMQGSAGGLNYELSIPWGAMRMTPAPGAEIRLGVVVYDNDGDGVRGAWEWGAGATAPTPVPRWFGRLRLLDVSRERAARYRKIAAALLGEPESAQYLERALLCLSEEEAAKERKVAEAMQKKAAEKPPATPAERTAKYRAAALEVSDIGEGRALLTALLRMAADAKTREEEIEKYLTAKPRTVHAGWLIQELQANLGGGRNFERAENWMRRCQLSTTERRGFYSRFAPTWNSWAVLGPFDGEGAMRGLDVEHGPERGVDPRLPVVFEEKEYAWKEIIRKKNEDAFFNLQNALGPSKELEQSGYCGYAWRKVVSVDDRKALLWVGAADIYSVWVNRRQVVVQRESAPRKDHSVVPITLNRGENEILLAVGVRPGGRLGFYCRVSDENGRPLEGLLDRFPAPAEKE